MEKGRKIRKKYAEKKKGKTNKGIEEAYLCRESDRCSLMSYSLQS
jgi:hypothetical protein